MNEVNELLDKLEKLENAPLIWVNKKVYDTSKEIERLNNKMNNIKKYLKTYDILPLIEKNNEIFKIINDIYFILENSPEKVDRLKENKLC